MTMPGTAIPRKQPRRSLSRTSGSQANLLAFSTTDNCLDGSSAGEDQAVDPSDAADGFQPGEMSECLVDR